MPRSLRTSLQTVAAGVLLVILACAGAGPAAQASPTREAGATAPAILAQEVREIADTSMISRAKKEKRISTAVRVAVVAGTAYRSDPDEIVGIAAELAAAAAGAAPHFADVISKAAAFAPAVARIEGSSGRIRTAAYAGARGAGRRRGAPVAPSRRAESLARARQIEAPPPEAAPAPPTEPVSREAAPRVSAVAPSVAAPAPAESGEIENPPIPPPRRERGRISLGDNAAFHLTADVGVRYDDNLFLSADSKVGSMIYSLTPGAEVRFGQSSLAHGSLLYREAFTRYARGGLRNVNLGLGNADFGYDNGNVILSATGSYHQTYGNNVDILSQGQHLLFRSDVLGLDGSAEVALTGKTSVQTGIDFSRTNYQSPGLVNDTYISFPLKLYYKATPKVDLSTGVTYGSQRPPGTAPRSRDLYFNVGARGQFTPKLSGEVSTGYRTRSVSANPKEHLWGFNGNLAYEVTPKTSAALAFSRDFRASALGESLKNDLYTLTVSTEFTPQLQAGLSVGYRDTNYGAAVFNLADLILIGQRRDHYWESSLMTSYVINNWLSASANYTYRTDHSTIPGIEFSDNILSLTVGLRY